MGPQLGRLSGWAVTLVGCAWIVVMTRICLIGIELDAPTQKVLLGAELAILALFAVVALAKGGAASPSWEWLNAFQVADLGGGLDADDDPPHGAHRALHGPLACDPGPFGRGLTGLACVIYHGWVLLHGGGTSSTPACCRCWASPRSPPCS